MRSETGKVRRVRLKVKGTRRRVKRVKEGMRITDYGFGVKIKELKAEKMNIKRK